MDCFIHFIWYTIINKFYTFKVNRSGSISFILGSGTTYIKTVYYRSVYVLVTNALSVKGGSMSRYILSREALQCFFEKVQLRTVLWIRIGTVSVPSKWYNRRTSGTFFIFLENINMLSKILKIMTHLTMIRKINHCTRRLVPIGNVVTKSKHKL